MAPTHEHHAESVAAYLVGALPHLEEQALERHLMTCESCRSELERLRVAAEALPRSVEQLEPPPSLKRSLMAIVAGEAAAPQRARDSRLRRSLAHLRPSPARLMPATAWVSAAFLLAGGMAGGYLMARLTGDDTRTVTARVDRLQHPNGSGSLVIPEGNEETAVLRLQGMRPPVGDRVYAIWLKRGGEVVPASLFNVGPGGSGVGAINDSLEGVDAILVTRERRGGAPAPTEEPVVSVEL